MTPHAQDLHALPLRIHLVNEPVLEVDAARVSSFKIADEFLAGRGSLKGILGEEVEQVLDLRPEIGGGDLLRVLLRMLGEVERPAHQTGLSEVFSKGWASPSLMDSRMPGMETRYSVS